MSLSVDQLPGFDYPPGAEPTWVRPTLEAMNRLLDLPPNWNSYGAGPIAPGAVLAALQFLQQTMRPDSPPPSVVPTSRGGVQLEWHAGEIDLEIRVTPKGEIGAVYEDAQGEWEQERVTDLEPLAAALATLARRG